MPVYLRARLSFTVTAPAGDGYTNPVASMPDSAIEYDRFGGSASGDAPDGPAFGSSARFDPGKGAAIALRTPLKAALAIAPPSA